MGIRRWTSMHRGLAGLAGLALCACGSSSSPSPPPRSAARDAAAAPLATSIDAGAPPAPVADRKDVTVTSVGDAPRRALRHAFVAGPLARTATITVDGHASSTSATDRKATALPLALTVAVGATGAAPATRADLRIDGVTVGADVQMAPLTRDDLAREWRTAAGTFVGLPSTPVGPPARWRDGLAPPVLATPPAATPAIAPSLVEVMTAIQAAAVSWPDQPIGAGARWRVERTIFVPAGTRGDGYFVRHRNDFTLVALDGDVATLRLRGERTAVPMADGSRPRMPHQIAGIEFELRGFTGSVTGEATIDLGAPLPVRASVDERTRLEISLFAAGLPLDGGQLTVEKRFEIAIAPGAPPAPPAPPFAPRTDGAYCAKGLPSGLRECLRFLADGTVARADTFGPPPAGFLAHLLSMRARDRGTYTGPWFATDAEVAAATEEVNDGRIRYRLVPVDGDRLRGTRVDRDGKPAKATYAFAAMTFAP